MTEAYNLPDGYHLEIDSFEDGYTRLVLSKNDFIIKDEELLDKLEWLWLSIVDICDFKERVIEELNWWEYNNPEIEELAPKRSINARKEFLDNTKGLDIEYVDIAYEDIRIEGKFEPSMLDELNFNYFGNSYGSQELFGVVYCRDSKGNPVWLTRGEYDGREWWEINTIPDYYKNSRG